MFEDNVGNLETKITNDCGLAFLMAKKLNIKSPFQFERVDY